MRKKIAVVSARGLGDGLVTMVLSHNLLRNGHDVTTYSTALVPLAGWFPAHSIKSFPSVSRIEEVFGPYEQVISMDTAPLFSIPHGLKKKHTVFYVNDLDRRKTMVGNFVLFCENILGLCNVSADNGLVVPEGLHFRRRTKRVVIHPTSARSQKNWPAEKFLRLASRLQAAGFEPAFVMCPKERTEWNFALEKGLCVPLFPDISEVAKFVCESGYTIGNDSGIGHLASNMGIPTLSLFARLSYSRLWRPGWGRVLVVTPTFQLPGAPLRIKYWKKFLTVGKVFAAFQKLCRETQRILPPEPVAADS